MSLVLPALGWLSFPSRGSKSVGDLVPAGFDAYVRVMHPAYRVGGNGVRTPVRWTDIAAIHGRSFQEELRRVDESATPSGRAYWLTDEAENEGEHGLWHIQPDVGHVPEDVCAALVPELKSFTRTPHRVTSLVWDGFGVDYLSRRALGAFDLKFERRCFVYESPIDEVFELVAPRFVISPALWFPADRAWCVSTDIDDTWSYVGGSRALMDRLLGNINLEAAMVSRDDDR